MRLFGLYILIPLITLISCSDDYKAGNETGEMNFELSVDNNIIAASRSAESLIPDAIYLDIVPDDKTTGTEKSYILSSNNGVFKRKSILNPGTYNCIATSHKSVERALNEEERGVAWYYSQLPNNQHFEITTENTTNVNLLLKVANTKISVIKNTDFTDEEIFSLYKVALYTDNAPTRKLQYTLMDGTEYGWFKADEDIMVQVYFTYKGQKYYKVLNINEKSIAANHHIITLKPSLGGIGAINIQVDNGVAVEYQLVILNVDGSVSIGSASGVYQVAVDTEIDKNEGGIEFNPEE